MKRTTLALLAAPLTLALAACNGEEEAGSIESAEALDPIPAPDGTSWTETVAVTEDDGYLLGNPDAPIKLVEYASYTCGTCAQFTQTASEQLKADYVSTGLVSYELRNLDRNGLDTAISALTRCGADETFHPLSDQVWLNFQSVMEGAQGIDQEQIASLPDNQRWVAVASQAGLVDFFAERGLGRDAAAACLADFEYVESRSETSNATADELGVTGTPTFFVNGNRVDGVQWSVLEPVLQRAGARSE